MHAIYTEAYVGPMIISDVTCVENVNWVPTQFFTKSHSTAAELLSWGEGNVKEFSLSIYTSYPLAECGRTISISKLMHVSARFLSTFASSNSTFVFHSTLPYDTPELLDNFPLTAGGAANSKVLPRIHLWFPVAGISTGHDTTGFRQDTPTGAHIPGPASTLPVQVQLTSCHGTEVESGASQAAQGMHHGSAVLLRRAQLLEDLSLDLVVGPIALASPFDADETPVEPDERYGVPRQGQLVLASLAALQPPVRTDGHEGATAADGRVQCILPGVVDDADGGAAVDGEPQRDAGAREPVYEVGGAVDGIDDECGHVCDFHAGLVRLFAYEVKCWVCDGQALGYEGLDCFVRLGYDVGGF